MHAVVVGCGILMVACGSGGGGVQPPPQPPPPPASYTISVLQGNNQKVFAGAVAPIGIRLVLNGNTIGGYVPLDFEIPPGIQVLPEIKTSGPGWDTVFWLRAPQTPFTTEKVKITAPGGGLAEITISSGPRLKKTIGNAGTMGSVVLPDGRVIAFGSADLSPSNTEASMSLYRADGTIEKLFAPGDLFFPIGSELRYAKFTNGEIFISGTNSDYWFLDSSLNVKRYINECGTFLRYSDVIGEPVPDADGNLYFFGRTNGHHHMEKMTPQCGFSSGGNLPFSSEPADFMRVDNGNFLAIRNEDYQTATLIEFTFAGQVLKTKTLPVLPDSNPSTTPGYSLGGLNPDGSYILVRERSQGLLFLNSDLQEVGERRMHTADGTTLQSGYLRGTDGAGNFYFGPGENWMGEGRLFKFNPDGELLWWAGSATSGPPMSVPPVTSLQVGYFGDGATMDPTGEAMFFQGGGGVQRVGIDGSVVTFSSIVDNTRPMAGPVLGPDGYLYTAHGGPWNSDGLHVVTIQAWDTSMHPISKFTIPEMPASVAAFAFSSAGELYLFDSAVADLHVVDSSHSYVRKVSLGISNHRPQILVAQDGNLLVSHGVPGTGVQQFISKFTTAGTRLWSKETPEPDGMTLDVSGRIWLLRGEGVDVWDSEGNFLGGGSVMRTDPTGVYGASGGATIAAHGNDVWFYSGGRIYITSAE
jgi:hypothetical protein